MFKKPIHLISTSIAIVIAVLMVNYFILAWSPPTSNPPGGTVTSLAGKWEEGAVQSNEIYYDDGYVGIGPTGFSDPGARLHVMGNNTGDTVLLDDTNVAITFRDADDDNFKISTKANDNLVVYGDELDDGYTDDDIIMALSSTGRVGIGTEFPLENLDVNGNVNILGDGRRIFMGRAGETGALGFDFANGEALWHYRTDSNQLIYEDSTGYDIFSLDVNAADNYQAYFGGRVGIGVNNPLAPLHIVSSSTNMDISTFYESDIESIIEGIDAKLLLVSVARSSYGSAIELADVKDVSDPNSGDLNNSWIVWRVSNNPTDPFILPYTNNLVFTYHQPGDPVWTYNEIYFTPDGSINALCYLDDGVDFGGTCPSDSRLKRDINYLSNDDWVTDLDPVSYLKKDNQAVGTHFGLIAQDAREVNPNLVVEGEDGLLRVRYGLELQMGMIQAIKSLKEENEAMRAVICELKPEAELCQ